MTKSLGLCLVGIGSVSVYHLNAIKEISHVHLSAVVSRSLEKARDTARGYQAPHFYDSLEKAIADPDVDCIVLCTPTQAHHRETLLCIEGHKHVLVEKPITDNYTQAVEVVHRAQEEEILVMAGQVSRFLEPYALCKSIIQEGGIGRPLHAIEHRLMQRKVMLSWFKGAQGHLINHWGSHPIDLFQWFFSSPAVRVYCHASANLPEAGGEDDVVLCVELKNNAVGTYHHTYHARFFDMSMTLIGDGGSLRVAWEGSPGSKGKGTALSVPVDENEAHVRLFHNERLVFDGGVEEVSAAGFVKQMQEFTQAVREGRPPRPSAADTVITMATVDAARKAACERRVVGIDEVGTEGLFVADFMKAQL
jgi:2-hydroxy-4-carboxymuconate semialdehyde hemiacetal dehydrogenase